MTHSFAWETPVGIKPYMEGPELIKWLEREFTEKLESWLQDIPMAPLSSYPHFAPKKMGKRKLGQVLKEIGITSDLIITPGGFQEMYPGLWEAYIHLPPRLSLLWLKRFNIENRIFRSAAAKRIAQDIWRKSFILTHMGMAFCLRDGDIIAFDLQHRCVGLLLCALMSYVYDETQVDGIPVRITINVSPAAIAAIDTNVEREQVATGDGSMLSALLTDSVKAAIRGADSSKEEVSLPLVSRVVEQYPRVISFLRNLELSAETNGISAYKKPGLLGAIARALIVKTSRTTQKRLRDGATLLFSGNNPDGEGELAAIKPIASYLGRKEHVSTQTWQMYRGLAPALEALANGQPAAAIRSKTASENDPFPFIVEEVE